MKKMRLERRLEGWESYEWDRMESRTMGLSRMESRIKDVAPPLTTNFQIVVLVSRIFGCHPHTIFADEKFVKTTKLQKFCSIVCSAIPLLSAAYLIHMFHHTEYKKKDKKIVELCELFKSVAILMSWFICGLMAVIRARNFENAIAAIRQFDRVTNFPTKTNMTYSLVVNILVICTWLLAAYSASSLPFESNVSFQIIMSYKIVRAVPFGVMSLEICKFFFIFVNLLKRFGRYNNIISSGNLCVDSIKGVYYQPLTVRDAFILRHWLTDSLNNFNKYYDIQIVYWFTLNPLNLIIQIFLVMSDLLESVSTNQLIFLLLTMCHIALICVICHFTCDKANKSGKFIFGPGGTLLKTTVSTLEILEFGFYIFRNPIRIMGMRLFSVDLPLAYTIIQASATYITFLLQEEEKGRYRAVNGPVLVVAAASSVLESTVTSIDSAFNIRYYNDNVKYQLSGTTLMMLSEMNVDFLEQKCQEGTDKSFESCIMRSKVSRRGDVTNDYILHKNPYRSPVYEEAFRRSIECPEEFWAEVAQCVDWTKPWNKVLDNSVEPFAKWYVGGEINACHNAVDRHVNAGYGKKTALIHDSPLTSTVRKVTYDELLEKTSRLAGALADMGVRKGDRVLIYMPLIPETIISILATARLGAIHSVVFGGFAPRELAARVDHAEPKVIIGASCGLEPTRKIKYTEMINEAMELITVQRPKCIIYQRRNVWEAPLLAHQEDWEEAMKRSEPHPCVSVEANDPLYILYTSGTTDTPKGVQRPVGGHIATLCWTMKILYGMDKNSVWWTASDLGWVVGHSYICYGPLLYGATSVMYEGKPDRTPDARQYYRVIEQHGVNALFTVPTVLRVLRRADPEAVLGSEYSTKSLKTIFVAGEHCDYGAKAWAESVFQVPILNHWWQTETGHAITATCLGLGHSTCPPKYSTGMPFPGYNVKILRDDGSVASAHELGRIVVKLPLPPGTMSVLYLAPDRFKDTYFSKFPGFYDTMDAGYIDEFGYVYVTARVDDVINVSGHRLSTSALEDVVLSHPDVVDTAVVGVPEHTKGDIPLCLYVMRNDTTKNEQLINQELIERVRQLIGPIASFKIVAAVRGLPRTRSGKTCRKSIADLARSRTVKIPSTIEDPSVYNDIKEVLQKLGYAKMAPDPEF